MSYRKQISYLELQENGQRIRSAGYARLESLDKEEILTVQLNGQEIVSGKGILLYLQWESGEQQLCEMTTDQGRASCEKGFHWKKRGSRYLGYAFRWKGIVPSLGNSKEPEIPKRNLCQSRKT